MATNSARPVFCRRGLVLISSPIVVPARPLYSWAGWTLRAGVEFQHAVEQALVELFGIAGGQVGAARAADQQRVAGEDVVLDDQAGRIRRVAGRGDRLHAHVADQQHVAIVEAEVDEGGRGAMAHHHLRVEGAGDLTRGGEMVGVGVGVDGVADREAVTRGKAAIALDGADLGIDHGGDVALVAADDVGAAAADFDGFKDHSSPPATDI